MSQDESFQELDAVSVHSIDSRRGSPASSGVTLPHQSPALLGHRQLCATRGSASAATTIHDQGITGKKCDFTSLPYSKIQAFSIETTGSFDPETVPSPVLAASSARPSPS